MSCQDPEASVDDVELSEGEFSEEELGSLAVNLGSLHHQPAPGSDTEGDFLDKCEIKNKTLSRSLEDEYKNNIGDDEQSVCSDLDQHRDKNTTKVSTMKNSCKIISLRQKFKMDHDCKYHRAALFIKPIN